MGVVIDAVNALVEQRAYDAPFSTLVLLVLKIFLSELLSRFDIESFDVSDAVDLSAFITTPYDISTLFTSRFSFDTVFPLFSEAILDLRITSRTIAYKPGRL